jgi:ankyrin repeat protein
LHTAAYRGYKDIAELLLLNGANVDAKTNSGITPLHWAEQQGHREVAELLRAHGGHDSGSDFSAWNPLFKQN